MFSSFYLALLLLLFFLIIRVVSFEWREKSESSRWRASWTWANAVGSFGASLVWGVGFANLLYGVPINSSGDFSGSFWDLFSVYTVLGGVTVVVLFAFHGATFLTLRTTGEFCERAAATARRLSLAAALATAAFLSWTVAVAVDRNDKSVFPPILPAALGIAAVALAMVFALRRRGGWAFAMTALGAVLWVATIFTSLYPRVMVSSSDFANSLTVDEIRDYVGADSLAYLNLDRVKDSTGATGAGFCDACFTGRYPVEVPVDLRKDVLEHNSMPPGELERTVREPTLPNLG
jgi:cytochrome d ubiquinol oxidase subunit II